MEYNKNELSSAINMLYSLPPHNGHFLLSPRWPLWRGSTVLCNLRPFLAPTKIWSNELFLLPYFFSVLSMVRCAPDYANLYKSVQNDVFLGKNLIVGTFIILFFSVDSSTCSAEDRQQGSSNVWSTYCERNQVGGIWTFQSSCALVPASYLIVLTPVLNERYWVKQKLSLLCIPSPNPATRQFEFPLNGRLY